MMSFSAEQPFARMKYDKKAGSPRRRANPLARMKYDKKDDPAEKPSPAGEGGTAVMLRITGVDEVS